MLKTVKLIMISQWDHFTPLDGPLPPFKALYCQNDCALSFSLKDKCSPCMRSPSHFYSTSEGVYQLILQNTKWHLDFVLPGRHTLGYSVSEAIKTGVVTNRARRRLISVLSRSILVHTMLPTPEQYRTVCLKLIRKFPKLMDAGGGYVRPSYIKGADPGLQGGQRYDHHHNGVPYRCPPKGTPTHPGSALFVSTYAIVSLVPGLPPRGVVR